ncbi:MAG: methyltransferase domain-containing protein [Chloroflexi bacterium]|nr:methyltransferase domain-containing protein [Chloroflexota bacterium]
MIFVCPSCRGKLIDEVENLLCEDCLERFPLVDGIPVFCEMDSFYEGKWTEPDESAGSLRNWLVKKQRFFVRRLSVKEGRLLDLGCGGGWRLFAASPMAVGIDVSRSSLAAARSIYHRVAAADLGQLPFPDETFALVVSSDVLGHVPLQAKDRVLAEMYRVLARGGRTLHYVEADGQDPVNRFGRRYPDLYEKYITGPEGHIGLETAGETAARFRRHGFVPAREIPCYRGLLYVNRVVQYFDNEYRQKSRLLSASVAVCGTLTRSKAIENLANVAVTLAMEVGDRILPSGWAGGMLVEYRKEP